MFIDFGGMIKGFFPNFFSIVDALMIFGGFIISIAFLMISFKAIKKQFSSKHF
jgi:hypothetical protein